MTAEFIVKRAANNEFYFVLQLPNGDILLTSNRYLFKVSCLSAVETAKNCSSKHYNYQKGMATSGGHFFVLRGADNEIVCTSEIYQNSFQRDEAMEFVKNELAAVPVRDLTGG